MARAKAKFTQADVQRAVKASIKAGLKVSEVQIGENGSISVKAAVDQQGANDDTELEQFRRQHGYG